MQTADPNPAHRLARARVLLEEVKALLSDPSLAAFDPALALEPREGRPSNCRAAALHHSTTADAYLDLALQFLLATPEKEKN